MNMSSVCRRCLTIQLGLDLGLAIQRFYAQIYPASRPNSQDCFQSNQKIISCSIQSLNYLDSVCRGDAKLRGNAALFLWSKRGPKGLFSVRNALFYTALLMIPNLEQPLSDEKSEEVKQMSPRGQTLVQRIKGCMRLKKPYPHLHFIATIASSVALAILIRQGAFLMPLVAVGFAVIALSIETFAPRHQKAFRIYSDRCASALGFVANPLFWAMTHIDASSFHPFFVQLRLFHRALKEEVEKIKKLEEEQKRCDMHLLEKRV